jgi:hypothetical protein
MSIYNLVLNGKKGLRSRYFRRNKGTDDYATTPNITMSGDVVIEFDINAPPQDDNNALSFRNISALNTFGLASGRDIADNAKMRVFSSSVPVVDTATSMDVFDNIFHKIRFEYTLATTSFKLFVDGVEGIGATTLGTDFSQTDVTTLWRDITTGDEMAGIIANLEIFDAGILIHKWAINSNSTTETDTVGGAVLTYVDGDTDDWALFQKQATGEWVGQELVVNSNFATGTDWDLSEGTTISGNKLVIDSAITFASLAKQNLSFLTGSAFRLVVKVSSYLQGTLNVRQGTSGSNNITQATADGSYIVDFIGVGESTLEVRSSGGDTEADVESLSAKEILNVA